ncbi:aminotransferase class V-fold PLP-dependent enzyme [Longimicrobium terrae]|nr:aminotransferase class V-fold PLP-dependent enzyme [Longimicrobium terrae]
MVRGRNGAIRVGAEPDAHGPRHGPRVRGRYAELPGIAAVTTGLDFLEGIGIENVNAHVTRLAERMLNGLASMRHSNGEPMVRFYGPASMEGRGGTLAFNLLDPEGGLVDFRGVEQCANDAGISLRTGFFCNPGAAEFAFEYADEDAFRCINTLTAETFNIQVFSDCMSDHPVGAVRVSVGIASNEADVDRLMEVLGAFRDVAPDPLAALPALATAD